MRQRAPLFLRSKFERAMLRAHMSDALLKQRGVCRYCLEPLPRSVATADHVRAIKNGGLHHRENIAAACRDCNVAKAHRNEKEFVALIKAPEPPHGLTLLMAWSRRHIWQRTHKACERIAGPKYRVAA